MAIKRDDEHDIHMYSDASKQPRATVRTIPHIPALEWWTHQLTVEGIAASVDLQHSETETEGDSQFLLTLYVKVPDEEPGENREGKIVNDEQC